ncbi:MAG TPA: glycosyl hydrolase family 28-related protein [Burkholderiaceae bacterium]|nr:glycosyl hydrolase family 28-related protein [Burkholderiaceae bacterium]
MPGKPAAMAGQAPQATSGDNCLQVPALPGPVGSVRSVAEFGAVPDDSGDDTLPIQRALDALKTGQTLVFPAGRYLMSRSLRVRVPGSVLDGRGATLHATNPDDQAIRVEADDVTVRSFMLTAITDVRRSAPWHARIAVYAENADGTRKTIRRTVIQDNTITHLGAPGTPGANGASAGGIMLLHADGFLVAGNTVVRTLADGIHMTSGSRNGRVLGNTVRETGDDMIAVVSYAGVGDPALGSAAKLRAAWATRMESQLASNIVIADNRLSGQYWGRGISVVGGKDISVRRNTLDNLPLAAGILVAREAGYESFGVNNVLVEGNTLTNVQNLAPPYDAGGKYASVRPTGHGAVEIHAAVFDDEAADALLRTELTVRNVKVNGNVVRNASAPGLRAAVAFNVTMQGTDLASGAVVARHQTTAAVQAVSSQDNRFEGIAGGNAMQILTAGMADGELHCRGNTRDGQPYAVSACLRAEPAVTGSGMKCTADGRVP